MELNLDMMSLDESWVLKLVYELSVYLSVYKLRVLRSDYELVYELRVLRLEIRSDRE